MKAGPHLNLMEFHPADRIPTGVAPSAIGILPEVNGVTSPIGYSPADLQTAYGMDNIEFGSIVGDGSGQTIAIVDAYDDPAFVDTSDTADFPGSDLAQFDQMLGIPEPPSFTKVNESGQTSPLPGVDPAGAGNINGNWEIEEALDIDMRMVWRRGRTSFSSRRAPTAMPIYSPRSRPPPVFPACPWCR